MTREATPGANAPTTGPTGRAARRVSATTSPVVRAARPPPVEISGAAASVGGPRVDPECRQRPATGTTEGRLTGGPELPRRLPPRSPERPDRREGETDRHRGGESRPDPVPLDRPPDGDEREQRRERGRDHRRDRGTDAPDRPDAVSRGEHRRGRDRASPWRGRCSARGARSSPNRRSDPSRPAGDRSPPLPPARGAGGRPRWTPRGRSS